MVRSLASLACFALLLAGCSGTTTSSPSSSAPALTGHELFEHFDAMAEGAGPAGWTPSAGSTWTVEANATAPSAGNVVRGHGPDARNWLLADGAGEFGDMDLNVMLNVLDRTEPGGAGVVFHFKDATHYLIIRYSPAEAGWHLFVANGGDPAKKSEATKDPATLPALGEWTHLKVAVEGDHVEAWQGSELVIDYESEAMPMTGKVGLFTRGDTSALFDEFEIDP